MRFIISTTVPGDPSPCAKLSKRLSDTYERILDHGNPSRLTLSDAPEGGIAIDVEYDQFFQGAPSIDSRCVINECPSRFEKRLIHRELLKFMPLELISLQCKRQMLDKSIGPL